MSISKLLLQKYAELIVRTGANVQKGQVVQLTISVEQHSFAAMVMVINLLTDILYSFLDPRVSYHE